MAEKIRLVQGDTRPSLVTTLTDSTTGAAINITGATVRLKFRAAGATTLQATIVGTVTNGAGGVVVFDWADEPTSLDGAPVTTKVRLKSRSRTAPSRLCTTCSSSNCVRTSDDQR